MRTTLMCLLVISAIGCASAEKKEDAPATTEPAAAPAEAAPAEAAPAPAEAAPAPAPAGG